jgi:hypothetical protein
MATVVSHPKVSMVAGDRQGVGAEALNTVGIGAHGSPRRAAWIPF